MLLKISGSHAVLHSRATPAVLAIVGRLEGRRQWLTGSGLKVEATGHNVAVLSELPGVQVERDERATGVVQGEIQQFGVGNRTFHVKTHAYGHQLEALAKMRDQKAFGLFMEQGTGKTKVILDWVAELANTNKITGVLIISKRGVHRQWIESELPKHLSGPYEGQVWPFKNLLPVTDRLQLLAFNYDALKSQRAFDPAIAFCARHTGRLLIVCDESQEIKNFSSGRNKTVRMLAPHASHRALTTGTPIAKDLTDEWAQFLFLDQNIFGIKYVTTFRNEYCIMGGWQNKSVVGHRNIERFKKLTAPFVFRATKEQVGILPKQYAKWRFDLSATQMAEIQKLRESLKAMKEDELQDSINATARLRKVQQAASGFTVDEDGKEHLLISLDNNPRINAMREWLDAGEGKAIIWARFKMDLKMIAEALRIDGRHYVEYQGSTSDKARTEAVQSFLDPAGAQILIANQQAAGTGLNLQGTCNRALYYTNSFSAIDRWQSEDRIHRIGTVGAVTYTDLIAKGSIDSYIVQNLKRKKGISDLVLSDALFQDFEDEEEMAF